jgi:hypothetical protein
MEGQVWIIMEELLANVEGKPARCVYMDQEILRVTLWGILHDRPMSWACRPENWPAELRPARLPDDSTVSRRWKSPTLRNKAYALHQTSVRRRGPAGRLAMIDGRPLPVSGCSKDPDARPGRAAGGMGKGYKMHALVSLHHVILAYKIHPMNRAESTAALELIPQVPREVTRVLGDGVYDSMRLHQSLRAAGKKLYTPLRQQRVGRRRQPRRLQLLRLWQRPIGRRLGKLRDEVERAFGQATNLAIGFKGLPPWARRERRVFRWMWGKNLLHHGWLLTKTHAA